MDRVLVRLVPRPAVELAQPVADRPHAGPARPRPSGRARCGRRRDPGRGVDADAAATPGGTTPALGWQAGHGTALHSAQARRPAALASASAAPTASGAQPRFANARGERAHERVAGAERGDDLDVHARPPRRPPRRERPRRPAPRVTTTTVAPARAASSSAAAPGRRPPREPGGLVRVHAQAEAARGGFEAALAAPSRARPTGARAGSGRTAPGGRGRARGRGRASSAPARARRPGCSSRRPAPRRAPIAASRSRLAEQKVAAMPSS